MQFKKLKWFFRTYKDNEQFICVNFMDMNVENNKPLIYADNSQYKCYEYQ